MTDSLLRWGCKCSSLCCFTKSTDPPPLEQYINFRCASSWSGILLGLYASGLPDPALQSMHVFPVKVRKGCGYEWIPHPKDWSIFALILSAQAKVCK